MKNHYWPRFVARHLTFCVALSVLVAAIVLSSVLASASLQRTKSAARADALNQKDLVKLERFPFARGKLVALRLGVTIDNPTALLARVLGPLAADVLAGVAAAGAQRPWHERPPERVP